VRTAIVLVMVVFTATAGDLCLTLTMKRIGEVKSFLPRELLRVGARVARTPLFWLGIVMLAFSFFAFLALLSWAPVSFIVPVSALGYAVGTLAAKVVLKEQVDLVRWSGVILVCIGVAVASAGEINKSINVHPLIVLLRWTMVGIACTPFGYYLTCIYSARKFFLTQRRKGPIPNDFAPPVSILKPVRGLDREAYENYASFCHVDYPEYEIVFAVHDDDDPAIPVIQKLIADFSGSKVRLLVGADNLGYSNKVCKLVRLVSEARYDLFVISDSDVRVDPDYLRVVVEHFRDPNVGAVTSLFRANAVSSFATYLDCLGASVEFCGGALVSNELEGTHFAHGATMATTREKLREIGGFEAMVDLHSDDFEFGNRISKLGYTVEIARRPVWMIFGKQTLWQYLRHELRWTIGLRHIRPGGHAGLFFTQGFALTAIAAAVAPSWPVAAGLAATYLILRFAMAYTVGIWGMHDPVVRKMFWLLPVRDFFAFPIWLASFLTNKIEWRGIQFTIRDGRLIPVTPPAERG
jgi:ceramide glucosyltransferase